MTADGIVVVHVSPRDLLMEFIHDAASASAALDAIPGWIGIHGHTHVPRLWARTPEEPVIKRCRQADRPVSVPIEERVLGVSRRANRNAPQLPARRLQNAHAELETPSRAMTPGNTAVPAAASSKQILTRTVRQRVVGRGNPSATPRKTANKRERVGAAWNGG